MSGISFEVARGECLLVIGPSGSGKSTLALAIAGLIPHEIAGSFSGSLDVGGLDVPRAPRASIAARVGIVFQDPETQLVMDTVEDDVAFGLENRGWSRPAMRARVPAALAEVGLEGLGRRRPNTLSGGQQQRLALAGVLAAEPAVLVLDEPTANLDPAAAAALFARLGEIRSAGRTTLVLVEHRVERAWPLADVVLALDAEGRPLDVGRPADVLARSREAMRAAGIWLPDDRPAGEGGWRPTVGRSGGGAGAARAIATDVGFAYGGGPTVLDGVDLELCAGERVALVGPNGSGKSTLGRLLVGLLRPTSGTTRLDGRDPARLPAAALARRAGYVFQDPERQLLAASVEREVMLGLRDAERTAAAELMDELGLPLASFGARSPYRLSGGEQRRLSLAVMLVRRPELLVLDEPTFGQDRRGYEALLAILDERVEAGATVLAATHDERLVADFAGRRVELAAGRVVGDTTR